MKWARMGKNCINPSERFPSRPSSVSSAGRGFAFGFPMTRFPDAPVTRSPITRLPNYPFTQSCALQALQLWQFLAIGFPHPKVPGFGTEKKTKKSGFHKIYIPSLHVCADQLYP